MKQDDILTVDIADFGVNGEGVARVGEMVVFVPFALVGERVEIKLTYVKKNYANAVLKRVLTPSPFRITPPCNRFTKCGGCDLMHLEYSEQLKMKANALKNTLKRIGNIDAEISPVVPSEPLYYRNKVQLPFGVVNGKPAVGFFRENSHKIVSITKCFLQGEWLDKLIKITLEYAEKYSVPVYDEEKGKGLLRHLVARYLDGQLCCCLVTNGDRIPNPSALERALVGEFGENTSLYLSVNTQKTNVIFGKKLITLRPSREKIDVLGVKLSVNPLSFMQVNDAIRDKIYESVIEGVKDSDIIIDAYSGVGVMGAVLAKRGKSIYNIEIVPEAVEDGNLLCAENGITDRVTNICGDSAIELVRLISDLNTKFAESFSSAENHSLTDMKLLPTPFRLIASSKKKYELRLNDEKRKKIKLGDYIRFTETETGAKLIARVKSLDRYTDFEELYTQIPYSDLGLAEPPTEENLPVKDIYTPLEIEKYGALAIGVETISPDIAVILDPPRKGLDEAVITALMTYPPSKLYYISCNPATLARDLKSLSPTFTPSLLRPYDMFPQTRHIETLVCLVKKS